MWTVIGRGGNAGRPDTFSPALHLAYPTLKMRAEKFGMPLISATLRGGLFYFYFLNSYDKAFNVPQIGKL